MHNGDEWRPTAVCGILVARSMNKRRTTPIAPGRIIAAWVCLLAVAMLWAPLAAMAWSSRGMACCNGMMCAAQKHNSGTHQKNARPSADAPMECEHSGGSRMASCSMTCCQQETVSFVGTSVFVLPETAALSGPGEKVEVIESHTAFEVRQAIEPPYTPPRA